MSETAYRAWFDRDQPVLKAVIDIYDENGGEPVYPEEISTRTGLDVEQVQTALRALVDAKCYFGDVFEIGNNYDLDSVGQPTGRARQDTEIWPSAEGTTTRLIAGLEEALRAAANDNSRSDEERSRLRSAAGWIGSFTREVAIGVLGGAGGNVLS